MGYTLKTMFLPTEKKKEKKGKKEKDWTNAFPCQIRNATDIFPDQDWHPSIFPVAFSYILVLKLYQGGQNQECNFYAR